MGFVEHLPLIIWNTGFIVLTAIKIYGIPIWDLLFQLFVTIIFVYPFKNNTGPYIDRFGTTLLLSSIRLTFSGTSFGLLYLTKRNISYIGFSVIIFGLTLYKNIKELRSYNFTIKDGCNDIFLRKYFSGFYISFFLPFLMSGLFLSFSIHLFLLMTFVFLMNTIIFTTILVYTIDSINEERTNINNKQLIIFYNILLFIIECITCTFFFNSITDVLGKILMGIVSIFFFENLITSNFLCAILKKETAITPARTFFVIICPDDIQIGEKLYKN